MDAKRVEAEKRVGEMTVTANGLNEELNTKNKMDLTSVIELEVRCILCTYGVIYIFKTIFNL